MYLRYEPVFSGDLKPGDLFCFEPGNPVAEHIAHNVIPPGGVGFGAYAVRTDEPCRPEDAGIPLYRVTVVKEGSE